VVAVLFQVPGEANVVPATVALAWQLSRQSVTGPIVSARVPEQLPDVLAAASLRLSRDQVSRSEQVTDAGPSCSASNDCLKGECGIMTNKTPLDPWWLN
jgi:aryl-alcohol dehydrogenase-like predicted oxidoreductase